MFSKLPIILCVGTGVVSGATTFHVTVSDATGALSFNPAFIQNAQQGDTVAFQFFPKNHTLTQSSFPLPCTPLSGGFDSGFQPAAPGTAVDQLPVVSYTVPAGTAPLWFHCKQQGPPIHCQQGMVFAINPTTDPNGNSFAKFQAAALALGNSTSATTTTTTTGTATTTPPPSTTSTSFVSPPPPQTSVVTVTVSASNSVYTTTYASWIGSPANPTPAANPVTHTVQVGPSASLVFDPPTVVASINDKIEFEFNAKNHTVSQSTFNSPCSLKDAGFDSGFMPVAVGTTTNLPKFQITVNDTAPIWVYCRQQGPPIHCQQGMVFAVNAPNGPNNFTAFQGLANNSASFPASSSTSSAGSSTTSGSTPPATGAATQSSSSMLAYTLSFFGAVIASLL